ncbi:MAG: hypothetical protein J3T61_11980 [Candidatus Brocadiales bacterium]|nr:hypothetical protein [Candidatus Bathyanammoxibius sp.]
MRKRGTNNIKDSTGGTADYLYRLMDGKKFVVGKERRMIMIRAHGAMGQTPTGCITRLWRLQNLNGNRTKDT